MVDLRSEQEMMRLILDVARADSRIKAVLLMGSRANPEIPRDNYQDYDITYFVEDVKPFYHNMAWIEDRFGKPAIVQLPELNTHPLLQPDNDGHFTYLMLFEDGNRIDLSFEDTPYIDNGEPAVILLDKEHYLPEIVPQPGFFHIKPPNPSLFADVCNEFWWCLNNAAKGIARDELPYVMEMFNHYVRDMLNQMVEWHIGIETHFAVSAGKKGKYFKKQLSPSLWDMYARTYADSCYAHIWEAIFTACDLFHMLAEKVAGHFGYTYKKEEENAIRAYLTAVKDNAMM